MKKSKVKSAARVFLILTIVFLAVFAGTFIGFQFVLGGDFVGNLGYRMNLIAQAAVFPFNKDFGAQYANGLLPLGVEVLPLILSIALLALAGITLILIILGIIVVCKRKKGVYSLYAIALLAILFVEAVIISSGIVDYVGEIILFFNGVGNGIPHIILAFAVLVGALLSIIFGYIAYGLGLRASKVKSEAEVGAVVGDDAAPVLSEGEVPPEVAEEVVPEVVPEYVPVLEPEPEPEIVAEEPEVVEDAVPEVKPEPAPVVVEGDAKGDDSHHVEVNVTNAAPASSAIDQNALASLLREVVRDIVRDEIARNNANQPKGPETSRSGGDQHIVGATFGGPLVVQYFNGGINGVNPAPVAAPAPEAPKEEPAPAPAEEPKPEPAPAPAEEPKPEPAPEAPAPVVEEGEKVVYERLTFAERLLQSDKELLDLYNELKNEILSYGVKSRVSANGDTFRLHKKMYVRITVAGKSLKLYFALNPDDYRDSKIPVQDAGHKGMYAEIPLVFKVRSGLSVRRCKELIQDVMEKDSLEQGEVGKVNWVKELKAELASGKKSNKDED